MSAVLEVNGLEVSVRGESGESVKIVDDVGFAVSKGEVLALIGESGSGKTTIALALMGYARRGCTISGGEVLIGETDVLALSRAELFGFRGNRVSYVSQSAAAAFNPSKTIMDQVIESAVLHGLSSKSAARAKAIKIFESLALPNPESIGNQYPHQVSGGQLQRLMAAMALMSDPEVLILDEPTTALDVTTQIDVLRSFKKVVAESGITAIYVSHDLSVVAQMADQIVVLKNGTMREAGATTQVLSAPRDEYTRALMAAAKPIVRVQAQPSDTGETAPAKPLLQLRSVTAGFGKTDRDGMPAIRILHDVDLSLERGSTLGIIGESGCGKSTLARTIAGLHPAAAGSVCLDGEALAAHLSQRTREQLRRVQIVFQNADTALNPAQTVEQVIGRPLVFYHGLSADAASKRIAALLEQVKLPASIAARRCAELSGGQKQRINLARALAADPDVILCDEVTSALDTVVGAAILDLIAELRRELDVAFVFISHDISAVRSVCDDILVLYSGRTVELGKRDNFAGGPGHPYTDLLIASVPELRQGWLEETSAKTVADASDQRQGNEHLCAFLDRCPVRLDGVCDNKAPPRSIHANGNEVLCHLGQTES
jgi:peptide/nickel transport system ATP-binding protein